MGRSESSRATDHHAPALAVPDSSVSPASACPIPPPRQVDDARERTDRRIQSSHERPFYPHHRTIPTGPEPMPWHHNDERELHSRDPERAPLEMPQVRGLPKWTLPPRNDGRSTPQVPASSSGDTAEPLNREPVLSFHNIVGAKAPLSGTAAPADPRDPSAEQGGFGVPHPQSHSLTGKQEILSP